MISHRCQGAAGVGSTSAKLGAGAEVAPARVSHNPVVGAGLVRGSGWKVSRYRAQHRANPIAWARPELPPGLLGSRCLEEGWHLQRVARGCKCLSAGLWAGQLLF